MSKTKSKNIFKTIGLIIVTVILSVTVCAIFANTTDIFKDDGVPLGVNSGNLIHSLDAYESTAGNTGKGIVWKVNSTGSITVDGTYSENETADLEFVLGTVIIEKEDYYTLSGAGAGSLGTYYIEARYEDSAGNEKVLYADFNDTKTSEAKIAEGTEVTIKIVVKPGVEFNRYTFKPTLVPGTESGRF